MFQGEGRGMLLKAVIMVLLSIVLALVGPSIIRLALEAPTPVIRRVRARVLTSKIERQLRALPSPSPGGSPGRRSHTTPSGGAWRRA
jgi:hypothetical protein